MKPMLVAEAVDPRAAGASAMALDLSMSRQSAAAPRQRDLPELAARAAIVLLFTLMAYRIGVNYLETGRVTGLLLLASEALVVVLTVFRRAPAVVDRSLRARLLTTLAMIGPPLVVPSVAAPVVPGSVTVSVCVIGLLIVIAGKLSLGRSFGLIPANRGIVSTGLYRVVRHPIYMGYLITHIAFVAANPTTWNVALLVVSDIALLARAVCEERTLAKDPQYREYQTRVRWRVLPGVF
jgi:protein-S-isoprenylcysteine O-methyltransferase Ste14